MFSRQTGGQSIFLQPKNQASFVAHLSVRESAASTSESLEGDQALQFACLMKQRLPSPIRCRGGSTDNCRPSHRRGPEEKSLRTSPTPGVEGLKSGRGGGLGGVGVGDNARTQDEQRDRGMHTPKPDSLGKEKKNCLPRLRQFAQSPRRSARAGVRG